MNEWERVADDRERDAPREARDRGLQDGHGNGAAPPREIESTHLDERIAESLRRVYPSREAAPEHVARLVRQLSGTPAEPQVLSAAAPYWRIGLAAAALIAVVATIFQFAGREAPTPFFKPTPLAKLYTETVASGFEPYYECEDDARFASTFAARLGRPVHLLPMPLGRRMLGLSYPGGLSRNTTAMLCVVDDRPVMVFVDVAQNDWPGAAETTDDHTRVFREVRDGLVFYEVTPFDVPKAEPFLAPQSPIAPR